MTNVCEVGIYCCTNYDAVDNLMVWHLVAVLYSEAIYATWCFFPFRFAPAICLAWPTFWLQCFTFARMTNSGYAGLFHASMQATILSWRNKMAGPFQRRRKARMKRNGWDGEGVGEKFERVQFSTANWEGWIPKIDNCECLSLFALLRQTGIKNGYSSLQVKYDLGEMLCKKK